LFEFLSVDYVEYMGVVAVIIAGAVVAIDVDVVVLPSSGTKSSVVIVYHKRCIGSRIICVMIRSILLPSFVQFLAFFFPIRKKCREEGRTSLVPR